MNVLVTYPAAEGFVLPIPEDPSTRWAPDDNEKAKCSQRLFTQTFHLSVQREVGLLFQNWWFLPDPTSFEPAVGALRSAAHDLDAQGAFIAPARTRRRVRRRPSSRTEPGDQRPPRCHRAQHPCPGSRSPQR